MVAFSAPMAMTLFFLYLGIAAVIPFLSSLLGLSKRVPFLMAAILVGGYVYLAAINFSHNLKYQDVYVLLLKNIGLAALLAVELLIVFALAYWLGAQCRAGILWVRNRLPGRS